MTKYQKKLLKKIKDKSNGKYSYIKKSIKNKSTYALYVSNDRLNYKEVLVISPFILNKWIKFGIIEQHECYGSYKLKTSIIKIVLDFDIKKLIVQLNIISKGDLIILYRKKAKNIDGVFSECFEVEQQIEAGQWIRFEKIKRETLKQLIKEKILKLNRLNIAEERSYNGKLSNHFFSMLNLSNETLKLLRSYKLHEYIDVNVLSKMKMTIAEWIMFPKLIQEYLLRSNKERETA